MPPPSALDPWQIEARLVAIEYQDRRFAIARDRSV